MGQLRGRAPDRRSRTIAANPDCGSAGRSGGSTAERTGVPHRKHDAARLPSRTDRPLGFGERANLRSLQSADLKIAQYSFTMGLSNCGHGHVNETWHHTPSDVTRNQQPRSPHWNSRTAHQTVQTNARRFAAACTALSSARKLPCVCQTWRKYPETRALESSY